MKPLDYYRKQLCTSEQALREHAFECTKSDITRKMVNDAVDKLYECLVDDSADIFEFGVECCGELSGEAFYIDEQCLPFILALKTDFAQLRSEELRIIKK